VDYAQRFAHQFWATGEQEFQLERKTQHPLADGFMRQDFVYQPLMVAGSALYAQNPFTSRPHLRY
jgi:hypothetical protein